MKSLIMITLTVAIITLTSTTTTSSQEIKNLDFINSTCKRTPMYDLCMATIEADWRGAKADMVGLAEIMVRAVGSRTREALTAVKNLQKKPDYGTKLVEAFRRCNEAYLTVIQGDVSVAMDAIKSHVPKFAVFRMENVSAEAHVCEAQFQGNSPLTWFNKGVDDLVEVAKAIIRNLL